jgi:hypothetical protein
MSSWSSYPSIYNLGHRAVKDLLTHSHVVEEKIDGSQFSFGKFEVDGPDGTYTELRVRSKGAIMLVDAPEKMFAKGAETVKSIADQLHLNWTYRGEFLAKPAHNTLRYDRVPTGHIILFDVSTGDNEWLGLIDKHTEAARIGLECVPVLRTDGVGGQTTLEDMRKIIDNQQSILGGQLIEGVVIKPLGELYGPDKKTLMGKFVSERFKEAHKQAWKVTSPQSGDILEQLISTFKVEGRWLKAIQHLRDDGKLTDAPQDIPSLLNEIQRDLGQEEKDEITRKLWKWAWPHISRGVCKGFPEFYKDHLLKKQFQNEGDNQS